MLSFALKTLWLDRPISGIVNKSSKRQNMNHPRDGLNGRLIKKSSSDHRHKHISDLNRDCFIPLQNNFLPQLLHTLIIHINHCNVHQHSLLMTKILLKLFLVEKWNHGSLRVLLSIYIFCAWTWNVSTAREICSWGFTNRGVWLSKSEMSDVFRFYSCGDW